MEFICTPQIHMIDTWILEMEKKLWYELATCKPSENQTTTHKFLETGFVSSTACGITWFFAVSLSSFTYLPQSCYHIIWFHEASWVSACEKTCYKFKCCCICMNVLETKHAFSLEETHLDCMLTSPCKISSRQSLAQSLAQWSITNLHSSPFQRPNKGNYLQTQNKTRHIKSLQNRNNSQVP